MMQQPTTLDPQLLDALFTIDEKAKSGQVQMTTPEGTPTVVGDLLRSVAPQPMQGMGAPQGPGIPQMAQQAGQGAAVQGMQQQNAMEQLMRQAQQMSAPPAPLSGPSPIGGPMPGAPMPPQGGPSPLDRGIVALPGANVVKMARGGITGIPEMTPEAAKQYTFEPDYSLANTQYENAQLMQEQNAPKPITPEERAAAMQQQVQAYRGSLEAMGLDPDMLRKEAESSRAFYDKMAQGYETRMQRGEEEAKRRALIAQLINARGSLTQGLASGARASGEVMEGAARQRAAMQEKMVEVQLKGAEAQRALMSAQHNIAMGLREEAEKDLQAYRQLTAEHNKGKLELQLGYAGVLGKQAGETAEARQRGLGALAQARGQDITLRGQDIDRETRLAQIGVDRERNKLQQANFERQERLANLQAMKADPEFDSVKKALTAYGPYAGKGDAITSGEYKAAMARAAAMAQRNNVPIADALKMLTVDTAPAAAGAAGAAGAADPLGIR